MSNLIPVQRPDKNGRVVTRHVRADEPSAAPSAALASAVPSLRASERSRMLSAWTAVMGDSQNEIRLDALSDEETGYICSLAEHLGRDADATVMWKLFNPEETATKHYMDVADLPPLTDDLRGLASYHRVDQGVPLSETLSFVRGLDFYSEQFGECTSEQKQALIDVSCVALKVFGERTDAFELPEDDMDGEFRNDLDLYYSFFGGDLDNERDGQLWIRNPRFVDMMLRRPEDAARIAAVMSQRQTIQSDIIEVMLDSGNHEAVIEGTL